MDCGGAVSDQQQNALLCASCGGLLKLAAAHVSRLASPGFLDFFKCDDCGVVSTRAQPRRPEEPPTDGD